MTDIKPRAPLCFVIGPIGTEGSDIRKHADMILNGVIKEAVNKFDRKFEVKRADEDTRPGMISDKIIQDIINSELVIADLTDLNPNAFYELGIRHATEKPTIHIAKVGTKLPFDNFGHDAIFVDVSDWHNIMKARDRLSSSVRDISDESYRVSNPITQANGSFRLKSSADSGDQLIAEMRERIANLERSDRAITTERKIINKINHPRAQQIQSFNGFASKALGEFPDVSVAVYNIDTYAKSIGMPFKYIGESSDGIIYDVDGVRVDMKKNGQGWSHPSIGL